MKSTISKVCIAIFCLLRSIVYAADALQQTSQRPSGKTKREMQIEQLSLPEDTSPRLTVRELLISGNNRFSDFNLRRRRP